MQAVSDVCIRTSITWGVDGYVKARVFGDQPSPDVDGCVAASGKVEGLNETRGHLWRECLSVPGLVVFCRSGSGILPFEHSARPAHDLTGLPAAAGGESVTSCPVVLDLVRDSSAAARSANVRCSPPPGFLPWSWQESRTQPACRLPRTGRQRRNGADSREASLPEHPKRAVPPLPPPPPACPANLSSALPQPGYLLPDAVTQGSATSDREEARRRSIAR